MFDGSVKPALPDRKTSTPFACMRMISRGSSPVHAHTKLQVKDPLRRSDRVLSPPWSLFRRASKWVKLTSLPSSLGSAPAQKVKMSAKCEAAQYGC